MRVPQDDPSYIYVNTDNETVSALRNRDYVIVDTSVNFFNIQFDSFAVVSVTNTFVPTDISRCIVSVSPVSNNIVVTSSDSMYVGGSISLSASDNKRYTLFYFNTGSLILGYSRDIFKLPSISSYPAQ
jgi:hypothetical protein